MNKLKAFLRHPKPALLLALTTGLCVFTNSVFAAPIVNINSYDFDLAQFTGASVTYRADGSVGFDGKLWDNAVGVDGVTLGELAAGQYGSDPGDQVSLNDRNTPDWLQLNYASPITISPTSHELVIHEISSYTYVDPEGTSFKVRFNGGSLIDASLATASNFATPGAEDVNQLVFNLYDFGFTDGQLFNSLYIENKDSGSGTSDPDFIFAGIAGELGTATVPEPGAVSLLLLGMTGLLGSRRVQRKKA